MKIARVAPLLLFPSMALLFASCGSGASESLAPPVEGPGFVRLDYAVAFVATKGHSDPVTQTPPHFGVDVISASNPAAQGPAGGLYVLLPNRKLKKLFPLRAHEHVPGLIDTPMGQRDKGAVVEPNVSEDGLTLYFSYFHDATWKPNGGGWQQLNLSFKGADLYRMELGPLLANPDLDPANLSVKRLTFKQYTGPAKQNVLQTEADKFKDAMNPGLAQSSLVSYWGTIDMHLTEMRTRSGLKALWVSNRARTGNSNPWVGDANHNFNLYLADFLPDGSLGPAQQFQYYTTTSALSPIPLRNGMAFSYQSSSDEPRRWDLQWVDSEGRWKPLLGYGHSTELFHLGTQVVDDHGADWFIGTKYYQINDGGFGELHRVRLSDAGLNVFVPGDWGLEPQQYSQLLTVGATAHDEPSRALDVDGTATFIGKFSTPRAGRKGGEYLMAYTPTSANRWIPDVEGKTGVFESHIAYRPNLEPFEPHEPIDAAAGTGLRTVIRDPTGQYDLLWPTPMLSWRERTGEPRQRVAEPIVDPETPIAAGLPFAEVGTSALYNTDIRPYDCYLPGGRPFSPNGVSTNEINALMGNIEGLRMVQDPRDPCKYLEGDAVLGVGINLTSNRTDLSYLVNPGYETSGNDPFREAVELLGVYSTAAENLSDHSFKARIPSDVPFEFHLLDKRYGMKLVDVRSWHSLKPRERRTDCGGCHQHEAGFAIPFERTEAASKPALDMTIETRFLTYDADCQPTLQTSSTPTVPIPEWRAGIWPGFQQYCGGCHDAGRSTDSRALTAFDYLDEESAYEALQARNYANSLLGALGSPAFWAARGERTDGRDNSLPGYQPNYAAGAFGYRFSPLHATTPGLCARADGVRAQWVYRFGQWIDNHMPRDTGTSSLGYRLDRFHPTIDLALHGDKLRLGYWDNQGRVNVIVTHNGNPLAERSGLVNGSFELDLIAPLDDDDVFLAIAIDGAGNRQLKHKTLRQLQDEAGP